MTPEAKHLKLCGIASLFFGIASCVFGVVLAIMDFDATDLAPVVAGLLDLGLGARGARLANVPNNSYTLIRPAFIIALLGIVAAGCGLYFLGATKALTFAVVLACALFVLGLGVFARSIKRELDRK